MDFSEYSMEWYVRDLLAEARADAARQALLGSRREIRIVRPAVKAVIARVRALYARWFSAPSAGSKPTTVRA